MDATPLRIALLGTPRSGNTWVRYLLAAAADLPMTAVHELTPDVLSGLPAECIVQLHWRRDAEFLQLLNDHGFRVLTLARHPFDVLISILQFCIHDSESDRWLLGRGGNESGIFGAMPGSRAFVEYATSDRVHELLGVTADWWNHPGAIRVRYEDIVCDPLGELVKLRDAFRPESTNDLQAIIDRHELAELRKGSTNNHFWKGTPGLWKQFLTPEVAGEVDAVHTNHFRLLGYSADADESLTASRADANWIATAGPSLRSALQRASAGHLTERENLNSEIARLHGVIDKLGAVRDRLANEHELALRQEHAARVEAARARAQLVPFEGLQGFSVRVARAVQTIRDRVPRPLKWRPPQPC